MTVKGLVKLGTYDIDVVEASFVEYKGRLLLFEYIRIIYYGNETEDSYFRFVDFKTGKIVSELAKGYHLGSAFSENDKLYVFAVTKWGGSKIDMFWSEDLETWDKKNALDLEGWGIFNNSVFKDDSGYVMAFEIDEPAFEAGVDEPEKAKERTSFTIRFAKSKDIFNWELVPREAIIYKDNVYAACPCIRYYDGFYYVVYLVIRKDDDSPRNVAFEPMVAKSKDLVNWEYGKDYLLTIDGDDKKIIMDSITDEQKEYLLNSLNINNSDVDMWEFQGETFVCYSWGDQIGKEFLGVAKYSGPAKEMLESCF